MSLAPVRTLVVDDEKPSRMRLVELLRQRPDVAVVGVAGDGREALRLVSELRPDLLFLDVEMPNLDGFGVLREIPKGLAPSTIFVTAYDRFAVAAFEAQAVDYLLKPFSDERFDAALTRALAGIRDDAAAREATADSLLEQRAAIDQPSGRLERIVVRSSGRVLLVDVGDIEWISAAGVYVEIHATGAMHLYRSSLNALLQRLPARRFVRVHRSVAVSTSRIVELRTKGHGDYAVVLKSGLELPLSRAYRAEIERWLGQPL